ncbi:MAG TPA: ABC transporter permease [Terriglobales bacterium]|nr:ABC transporter permease [Terriglobales bacterium]
MSLANDLRYALRTLRQSPGFAAVAILTLALGIGANTAVFSLVNGLVLHPPGINDPARVMALRARYDKLNLKSISISPPDFRLLTGDRRVFSTAALADNTDFDYLVDDVPHRIAGLSVSWQWFDVFGARPLLGRTFLPQEDQPHANHEVVLSYSAWQRLFGGDPAIVGRSIQLSDEPYRVVGVMPADFVPMPTQPAALWVPLALPAASFDLQNSFNESLFALARLAPGVSQAQAESYVQLQAERFRQRRDPYGSYAREAGWGLFALPVASYLYGDLAAPMVILLIAVGLVLLIACANIAGLLLARAGGRAHELAIRASLGAGRGVLLRQGLTESGVLAALGTLVGVAFAQQGIAWLWLMAPRNSAPASLFRLDGTVLAFLIAIGIVAALLAGAAPAWRMARFHPGQLLQEGGRGSTGGRARQRLRSALVVGEIALSLALLVGAGLLVRSLARIGQLDPGFQPHGVTIANLDLPARRYDTKPKLAQFYSSLLAQLRAQPGVSAAALVLPAPFSGYDPTASFAIAGRPTPPGLPAPHGRVRLVSPDYFAAMGIPLRAGRWFTPQDTLATQPVAVIDESLARQYWPGQNPLGQRIIEGPPGPPAVIVGVVGFAKQTGLVGDTGKGVYYFPTAQRPRPQIMAVVKSTLAPAAAARAIQHAVGALDPELPAYDIATMDQRIAASLGPRHFAARALAVFALIALLMAALGLYGLVSYTVAARTREIGLRIAFGARRRDVLAMILGESLRLVALALGIGLLVAYVAARFLASQLYGIGAFDALTFLAVAAALVAVALAASWLPARRAAGVDPMEALRYE